MASGFKKVRFQVADQELGALKATGVRPLAMRGEGARPAPTEFKNDEAAARYYLSQVFGQDKRPAVRGLVAPERAELVPDLRKISEQSVVLTKTRLVSFEQIHKTIPVFGSRAVVEMDENRELLNASAEVDEVKGVSPVAALSPAQALAKIAELAGVAVGSLSGTQPPQLNFYRDEKNDTWHLAYFFRKVPAAPPKFMKLALSRKSRGHGMSLSPRQVHPQLDYLVDAHDGTVLFYYSATPLIGIPTKCKGVDELGKVREFWGSALSGGFELNDPMRFVKTLDHQSNDIMTDPLPGKPIENKSSNWGTSNTAAVSAHANATDVFNFYNSVLMRDGIDDKRMDLISIVNCTYSQAQEKPQWHNAVWYENRMWYGWYSDEPGGERRSYAQFLDVIAHELTHGVTDNTSQLVYEGQSGALNESFSDIFGVIINNWYTIGPDKDVAGWNWEIGPGLGGDGLPLRDMSDPTRTGDPDHMKKYLRTKQDSGGVHTNSNIHNKAAYNVLTAQDQKGKRVFTVREVAVLYYLCLTRLNRLATFSDVLDTLLQVAKVYWAGDTKEREERVTHILSAYSKVGIKGQ